jgi:Trypsin-co-occurring domain 1
MTQLVPIELEDGTKIYIEATEGVQIPTLVEHANADDPNIERPRQGQKGFLGNGTSHGATTAIAQNFQAIESTIRTYTHYTLQAFKEMANANVNKVTLQFGIRIGGEAGVPYVTRGTAESNLNITVECSFKDS